MSIRINKRKAVDSNDSNKIQCISEEKQCNDEVIPLYTRDILVAKKYNFNLCITCRNDIKLYTSTSLYSKLVPPKVPYNDVNIYIKTVISITLMEEGLTIMHTCNIEECKKVLTKIPANGIICTYMILKRNEITSFHITVLHDIVIELPYSPYLDDMNKYLKLIPLPKMSKLYIDYIYKNVTDNTLYSLSNNTELVEYCINQINSYTGIRDIIAHLWNILINYPKNILEKYLKLFKPASINIVAINNVMKIDDDIINEKKMIFVKYILNEYVEIEKKLFQSK